MQNDAANEEIHRIVRQRAEIILRGDWRESWCAMKLIDLKKKEDEIR